MKLDLLKMDLLKIESLVATSVRQTLCMKINFYTFFLSQTKIVTVYYDAVFSNQIGFDIVLILSCNDLQFYFRQI